LREITSVGLTTLEIGVDVINGDLLQSLIQFPDESTVTSKLGQETTG